MSTENGKYRYETEVRANSIKARDLDDFHCLLAQKSTE